jgi:hypothetical protein
MREAVAQSSTPKYKLIGISGQLGAGKDTAADIIETWYPGVYRRVPFAYNVKLVCSVVLGTTLDEQLSAEGKARKPSGYEQTNGYFQQVIGQGLRDLIHPDVWVKAVMNNPAEYKIVPDVRYPGEVTAIEDAGGIVIRLERDEDLRAPSIAGRPTNHSSEISLDQWKFSHTIKNNGSVEELGFALSKILL